MGTILFRCDGNVHTGLGHASRSLAVAEALIERGQRCVFLGSFDPVAREWLEREGIVHTCIEPESWSMDDARAVVDRAGDISADGIVIDSYDVGADYVGFVEQTAAHVLLIDDFARLDRYESSAVLNFTTRAAELDYPSSSARYFLGPRWFPARRAIRRLRGAVLHDREVRHVLLAAGANDRHDFVLPAVHSLFQIDPGLSIHAVVGEAYMDRERLAQALIRFEGGGVILSRLPDLASELVWSDLCICTAGLTKYEAAYAGIPCGIVSQNEGQESDARCFVNAGLAVNLGNAWSLDAGALEQRLRGMLLDRTLLEGLRSAANAAFPADPTGLLAEELLKDVFV